MVLAFTLSSISGKPSCPFLNASKSIPNSCIAAAAALLGFISLESAPRKDVPAFSPSIPLLDIKPIAAEVSSKLIPNAWATGPVYSIAFPISENPAAVLFATKARLSVTRCVFWVIEAVSFVTKPNCSKIEVDADITVLKSSPEAFEASNTVGIAPRVWLKSYPFLIISAIPSFIEEVSIPYCLAHSLDLLDNISIFLASCLGDVSSASKAWISVIWPLKLAADCIPFAKAAVIAIDAGAVLDATESSPLLTFPKPVEIFGRIDVCLYCSTAAAFNWAWYCTNWALALEIWFA